MNSRRYSRSKELDGMQRYTLGRRRARMAMAAVRALYLDRTVPPADLNDDEGLSSSHRRRGRAVPRGALLSHRGLIAASLQTQLAWQLTTADVNLGVLPLFHVAAIGFLLATQQAGGRRCC
jgi:hypothetical protein